MRECKKNERMQKNEGMQKNAHAADSDWENDKVKRQQFNIYSCITDVLHRGDTRVSVFSMGTKQ